MAAGGWGAPLGAGGMVLVHPPATPPASFKCSGDGEVMMVLMLVVAMWR